MSELDLAREQPTRPRAMAVATSGAVLALLMGALGCQAKPQQPATGIWQGRVATMSFDLAIAVHLGVNAEHAATVACDFVEYRAMGQAADDVVNDGREVRFALPWASFKGAVDEHGDLRGVWRQGPRQIDVVLRPTHEVILPKRPQEPRGELPYRVREVLYSYVPADGIDSLQPAVSTREGAINLAATLTLPAADGPHPAVVLISGSGPDTRDAPIMGHRLFLVLADYLTRAGYAVLRYDERGQGQSSGDFATTALPDLAMDVRAGVRFLGGVDDVDGERIALVGHSEGGLVAPIVAGGPDGARIKCIVSLGGPAVATDVLLARQFRLLRTQRGMKPSDIEVLDQLFRQQVAILRKESSEEQRERQLTQAVHESWEKLSKHGRGHSSNHVGNLLASTLRTNSPKFRGWLQHDVDATLRAVKCSFLLLSGSKDLQVDPRLNLPAARKAFELAGHQDATLRELAGLNHLLQSCTTGSYREYAQIEETMATSALSAVRDWLHARLMKD